MAFRHPITRDLAFSCSFWFTIVYKQEACTILDISKKKIIKFYLLVILTDYIDLSMPAISQAVRFKLENYVKNFILCNLLHSFSKIDD